MKSTRFLCLVLMIKYTFKTMDVMNWVKFIRVNLKNSYLNNYSKKLFPQRIFFNFQPNQGSVFFVEFFVQMS